MDALVSRPILVILGTRKPGHRGNDPVGWWIVSRRSSRSFFLCLLSRGIVPRAGALPTPRVLSTETTTGSTNPPPTIHVSTINIYIYTRDYCIIRGGTPSVRTIDIDCNSFGSVDRYINIEMYTKKLENKNCFFYETCVILIIVFGVEMFLALVFSFEFLYRIVL